MKKVVVTLLFFLLLNAFTIGLLWKIHKEREGIYLEDTTRSFALHVSTRRNDLKDVATLIYKLRIGNDDVKRLMAEAADTTDFRKLSELRRRLYKTLLPVYHELVAHHIRQLHFHLPGPVSFLRFHRPH